MEQPPPLPPLQCVNASDWQGRPIVPQQWLVDGMIPMHTTTALSGDGGLGKSLLAMQLMTCCAAGKRFLNRDTIAGPVLGLFCEDRENMLHARQEAINTHYEINYADLPDLHYLPRVGEDNSLVLSHRDIVSITPFFNQLREMALDLHTKLIVIDTAADTFMANENIRTQVRFYVQLLNGLANDINGAVLLLLHPSLSGLSTGTGISGSTSWHNSVRSRWYLERPKLDPLEDIDPNVRILSQKKSNYGAIDTSGMELQWESGIFKFKLEEGGLIKKLELNNIANKCLEVIRHCNSINVNLSVMANSKNYAPRIIKEKLKDKTSFKDIEKAFNQLLDRKKIVNEPFGYSSRNQTRVMAVDNTAIDCVGVSQHTD